MINWKKKLRRKDIKTFKGLWLVDKFLAFGSLSQFEIWLNARQRTDIKPELQFAVTAKLRLINLTDILSSS